MRVKFSRDYDFRDPIRTISYPAGGATVAKGIGEAAIGAGAATEIVPKVKVEKAEAATDAGPSRDG